MTAVSARMPLRPLLVVAGLYLLALAFRLVAAAQVPFPATEPAAYYASVAASLVGGEGLVSHGVWSYATPPLVVPKPAFELWLPMSTFVSAAAMTIMGASWSAAQLGGAVLGAFLAPLAWAMALGAARYAALDVRRAGAASLAAGILAAILGPLVLGSAVPDSYTPFAVFTVAAALLVPRVLGAPDVAGAPMASRRPSLASGLGLGVMLGLAYLSRQEAVWVGLTVLLMLAWSVRGLPSGTRLREAFATLWPILVGGLVIVTPWLIRNADAFGNAFPGQALDNMFFVRNEDMFAFLDRPTAARYLGQGLGTVLSNPLLAIRDGLVDVLLLAAFPVGLAGLVALVGMRRSPSLRHPALATVLASGGITFLTTALLFPVATRWGTFLHASGPLLVGLTVTAALGADALMARVSRMRGWGRTNVLLGPVALIAMTVLLSALQLTLVSRQAGERQRQMEAVAAALGEAAGEFGVAIPAVLITDHPMWLADALDRDAVALPDEELASVLAVAERFGASWVVVVDERGRYPAALLAEEARDCLADDPRALDVPEAEAWLFRLAHDCLTT
jgi:hypothetical protein